MAIKKNEICILFMQAFSLFQPCQADAQISFLQNCLMNTAVSLGVFFYARRMVSAREACSDYPMRLAALVRQTRSLSAQQSRGNSLSSAVSRGIAGCRLPRRGGRSKLSGTSTLIPGGEENMEIRHVSQNRCGRNVSIHK